MRSTRTLAIVLIIAGIILALLSGLWLASQVAEGMSSGGALIGAGVAFIPVLLLEGYGLYLLQQGGAEAKQQSEMQKQRRLLDLVKSRGQISLNDLALELQSNVDEVKIMIDQLVGLQVFSGYVNWNARMLYSVEASQLRELTRCKNCGGEIRLAGKGVVECPFCGTQYFLT